MNFRTGKQIVDLRFGDLLVRQRIAFANTRGVIGDLQCQLRYLRGFRRIIREFGTRGHENHENWRNERKFNQRKAALVFGERA